jgi:hypothetical protein
VSWTIVATSCVSGIAQIKVAVSQAVEGDAYTLVGTSGAQQSNTVAAPSSSFTATFALGPSWHAFDGYLKSNQSSEQSRTQATGMICPGPSTTASISTYVASGAPLPSQADPVTTSGEATNLAEVAGDDSSPDSGNSTLIAILIGCLVLIAGLGFYSYRTRIRRW